jgi:hypothetical protein
VIVRENALEAASSEPFEEESCTSTVKKNVPATVGTPLNAPVMEFSVTPVGSEPAMTVHPV